MDVDLLYFTYNRLDHTRITLPALLEKSGHPFRLTVVDNGSADGTPGYLHDLIQQYRGSVPIKLILNQHNEGLSKPTNEFWKRSRAELVGKIDNDILVEAEWLKKLVNAHQQLSRLAVVGGLHFPLDRLDVRRLAHNLFAYDTIRILRQPHIGGNYVAKLSLLKNYAGLNETVDSSGLKIGGWTGFQKMLTDDGYYIGYYYPFIRFEHLHNAPNRYFKEVRGMSKKKYIRWEKEDGKNLLYTEWDWQKKDNDIRLK